jgi:hypothetical protein
MQINNCHPRAHRLWTAGAVICLLALVPCSTVAQEPRLTKLAPDEVTLQSNNGIGQLTVIYGRKRTDSALPQIEISDAIGTLNKIPKANITAEWTNPQPDLLTLNLKVDTKERLDTNVPYKGKLIFSWPDAQQTESFTILDATTVAFDLSAAKVDAFLLGGQPSKVKFVVTNTGKEEIVKISVFDLDLESATTHRRATFGGPQELTLKIGPGQEKVVEIALPTLPFAGVYSGLLNVVANDEARKSIPLTLTTRGPNFGMMGWLPFLLFFAVLGLGYFISLQLENWFGLGGFQRAQATITLDRYKKTISKWLGDLKAWEDSHSGITVPTAKLRMNDALNELTRLLSTQKTQSTDTLVSTGTRMAPLVSASLILMDKLGTAASQWLTPETLKPVVVDLDAVDMPDTTDGIDKYRQDLNDVLEQHAPKLEGGPAGAPMPMTETPSVQLVEQLEIKVERMALVHRLVVAIVVFSTAYLTLYWSNLDFGTLPDYFGVFFWSLGLTKTGTDILAKPKSSYTPPA